jgi:hypothetical protein
VCNQRDFLPNETTDERAAAGRESHTVLALCIEQPKFIGHFGIQDRPRRARVEFGE